MTHNELVGNISVRVRELADMKINELRMLAATGFGGHGTGSMNAIKMETLGDTRGRLIETIVVEEFSLENDRDYEE